MRITGIPAAVADVTRASQKPAASAPAKKGEFKELLSDAIGAEGNSTADTSRISRQDDKPVTGKAKTSRAAPKQQDAENTEALTQQAAVSQNAQQAAEVQQDAPADQQAVAAVETSLDKAVAQVMAAITTQPLAAAPVIELPADTAPAEVTTAAGVAPVAIPAETQAAAQTAADTGSTVAEVQDVHNRQDVDTQQNTQILPAAGSGQESQVQQAQATQTDRPAGLPDEVLEDVVSVEVETVTQVPETQAARQMIPNQQVRHEEAQSRFDEMLARASRELGQGKTEDTAEVAGELPVQAADTQDTIEDIQAPDLPEQQADETKAAETGTRSHAPEKAPSTPVTEQKPLKEMPKADETVLGMVNSKPQTPTPEAVRSEPAAETRQAAMPEQADQIRAEVIKNLEEQKMEFRMQLQPQELGRVNVKMVLQDGRLAVEIAAANPKSAEILSKQAESLIASLKLGNIEISSVNVVTSGEAASGEMNSPYNLNNFQSQTGTQQSGQGQSSGGQSHSGTSGGTEDMAEESADAPQRLLNYHV